jgi:hypothetical protein
MMKKPGWLIFAESCRSRMGTLKGSKGGKRENDEIYRWYVEARERFGYEGTEHDWHCLLGWRGRR